MLNFIRSTISNFQFNINSVKLFLNNLQISHFLPAVLMSIMVMASLLDSNLSPKAITKEIPFQVILFAHAKTV